MPISESHFAYADRRWLAQFESYDGGKRITWAVRPVQGDERGELAVSGHWTAKRGAYSVAWSEEHETDGLIDAALSRYPRAIKLDKSVQSFTGCCSGRPRCARCRAVKLNNKRVRAQIEARVRRLFDTSILTGDEPLPHVYDGSLKGKRRERKYGEGA